MTEILDSHIQSEHSHAYAHVFQDRHSAGHLHEACLHYRQGVAPYTEVQGHLDHIEHVHLLSASHIVQLLHAEGNFTIISTPHQDNILGVLFGFERTLLRRKGMVALLYK